MLTTTECARHVCVFFVQLGSRVQGLIIIILIPVVTIRFFMLAQREPNEDSV